ncbi:MAG: hypothetical protein GYB68_02840 [Chloroflexi bacterium]|nr:hypothetical protein [Chloroflexota bacterium]
MSDVQQEIVRLGQQVSELEDGLARVCQEYADAYSLIEPFAEQFSSEVLPRHKKLLVVQREIADLNAMLGDDEAKGAADALSPLLEALNPDMSVSAQFERAQKIKAGEKVHFTPKIDEAPTEMQELFRAIVIQVHPKLTNVEEERIRHERTYDRARRAYARRDGEDLKRLAQSVNAGGSAMPAVADQTTVDMLRNRIRKLEVINRQMEARVYELQYGDISKLRDAYYEAKAGGRNLMNELVISLKAERKKARAERDRLREKVYGSQDA